MKETKIVLWLGSSANQKALAHKIASRYKLAGIVIDKGQKKKKKRKLAEVAGLIIDRLRFRSIYAAWNNLMHYYSNRFSSWPDVPVIEVTDINEVETAVFTNKLRADLVVVSGTALVKKPLLQISVSLGIINLHTGLSPFVKGGPNCTNWCISNAEWHLVGNTIMWLNAGIDAGNIITSETIDIRGATDLNEAHRMVMDHAHNLYLRAITYLLENNPPYLSVPQESLGKGKLFLTKMWTAEKKRDLLRNWRNRKLADKCEQTVRTVPLNSHTV